MHPNGQILTKLGNIQEVIYNRKAHARIANAVILAKKNWPNLPYNNYVAIRAHMRKLQLHESGSLWGYGRLDAILQIHQAI